MSGEGQGHLGWPLKVGPQLARISRSSPSTGTRCSDHKRLAPVFESLTPLPPLSREGLRQAVVEPAKKRGYRFEDEAFVDEIVSNVEGVRGALPLLAFAVARLWEKRDREEKLLTRAAYQEIAGVEGALAQHAEATMDRIGSERQGLVREIFRNLVTAQGTRAVIDREELLSAFPDRPIAEGVLGHLIDARLLTSYEVKGKEDEPSHHRIEIVHESLLKAWPRLVRWQMQDEEGAQLRDELRQAARAWEEHDRADDRLWSGTAFREYQLWRERYPGGLTDMEEAFSSAMTSLATRRRCRRRIAGAAAVIVLAIVAVVFAGLWRRSVLQTRRAEASELVTLGRSTLEADRTEALAYSIASLERADTPEGRRLALRALWAGPPATALPELAVAGSGMVLGLAISPDGHHIAAGYQNGVLHVFPWDGGAPVTLRGFEKRQGFGTDLFFSPDGRLLVGGALFADGEVRVWETEGWKLLRVLEPPEPPELLREPGSGTFTMYGLVEPDLSSVLTVTFRFEGDQRTSEDVGRWVLRRWPLDGGPPQLVGEVAATLRPIASLDLSRGLLTVGIANELHLHRLDTLGREPPRIIGRHSARFGGRRSAFDPAGARLAACDFGGTLRVWRLDGDGTRPERELEAPGYPFGTAFSPDGARLAHTSGISAGWLWDLRGPAGAEPLRLGVEGQLDVAFTPDGRWLVTTAAGGQSYGLALWPLSDRYPRILRSAEGLFQGNILFHPDGSRMFAAVAAKDGSGAVVAWPLTGGAGLEPTVLFRGSLPLLPYTVDPRGRFVLVGSHGGVQKIPLDGGAPTTLEGIQTVSRLGLDPTGRYLAGRPYLEQPTPTVVVLDLETGERLELEEPGDGIAVIYFFDTAGRLLVVRGGVLSRWDPETRATEVLLSEGVPFAWPVGDGRRLYIGWEGTGVRTILNVEDGSRTALPQAHQPPSYVVFGPTGSILVSGSPDGEIRVGPILGEEPHVLLGHGRTYTNSRVSPDGRWIASIGYREDVVRLWPMPDLSRPPLHTLPYDELMARLKALTNLRAVPDEESHTGYSIEPDFTAYRGWEEVPTW